MSKEMSRPTPPLPAQPMGILVKGHSGQKHVGGVSWDEEVIAEHDLLRGTREKITEPKTPYNRERIDGVEDDEDVPHAVDPQELASRLQQLQHDTEVMEQQQQHKKDFKEKRKQHYNEFQQSKLLLQTLQDEDDE